MTHYQTTSLPFLLAGPIVRKSSANELVIWFATSEAPQGQLELFTPDSTAPLVSHPFADTQSYQIGEHAWVCQVQIKHHFTLETLYQYELVTQYGAVSELYPDLRYKGETRFSLWLSGKADHVLHGSCRNPHHFAKDALVTADEHIERLPANERPDLLMMSGDQIYADHVAGPTLYAIHSVIERLGLYTETFEQSPVANSEALYQHEHCFYGRGQLLPHSIGEQRFFDRLLPRKPTPIFSSTDNDNHLISLAEFFAMYLLMWSPALWQDIHFDDSDSLQLANATHRIPADKLSEWQNELKNIREFASGLGQVQRLMAHLPTYMIFDDHDVTDDWNLTVGWEQAAYSNAFSKRIIGNALISYWLFQGWGNEPDNFDTAFHQLAAAYCRSPQPSTQDAWIAHLYPFEKWHYTTDTSPKMVVLDTRTRRWRSESRMNKPSGLMDWEAMMEFQQALMNEDKVIIVSAAPMFGVKFIEALQRMMTWLGKPLVIDAENWMAHPGSANTLVSIFTHTKTPSNYVILSGDVHYSFAYDIQLRSRKSSPNIFQITCSGIKNQFPEPLLSFCDTMDRLLYSPRSPLNWLTKRKRLKIRKRAPSSEKIKRLVNCAAIGELKLDKSGKPSSVAILTSDGQRITFAPTQQRSKTHD
ncbi:alkaline phosphatase D family protein [Vibrio fluvialis]|nr:alkaline phosphatase D family protein [Vibrio fluvialis]EMA2445556.1 alkaline phosphatase D family protein [Vibrio fluvialis]MBY7907993.1 alkaline phosphatase D family protein [Vibrio fluvialis]MBY8177934.1 alkaline phosphatase D family protein [Vibrio fluvialis]MBY8199214.1 alkaline phosphatase D family protein [Vibrio fluvialis]